ncbi:MAG: PIN domain-containing protein [Treponema sp.]|nr:PIN domain-containing protein [Treponema sp.]
MVVLIDTNIILDHLIPRMPYGDIASTVFQYCFQRKCDGYVASHSITNIFYILRKQFSSDERKRMLLGLCDFIEIAGVQKRHLVEALKNENFDDLEDCLQTECAKAVSADYIITRNIDDFTGSSIPAILPEDFLKKMEEDDT